MATPATAAESRRRKSSNTPDINPKYTIRKPHGDRFLKLDFYHLEVLGGDRNLTSVFDALLYFSNGKVKLLNGREDRKAEPWFEVTEAQLRYQTGNINEKTIRAHVATLVDRGFLTIKDGEINGYRVTHKYLLNYEAMDRAVDRNFPIGSFTDGDSTAIGSFTDEPSVVLPTAIGSFTDEPSVVLPTAIGSFTDIYKEEEVKEYIQEEKQEKNLSLSSDQSQNPNPLSTEESLLAEETPLPAPAAHCEEKYSVIQSTSYDLRDDLVASAFIQLAYSQRTGRKIGGSDNNVQGKLKSSTNASLRFSIEEAERKYSMEDFRTAMWCYLDSGDDFVRKAKWSLRLFLSDPMRYLPDTPSAAATQSPRPVPTRTSPEAPASVPAQFADPLKNPLTYINTWNTIVYDSPVDVDLIPGFTMAGLKKAISGGDFPKCFERVFEKCQRMNANKPDTITFDGLFMGYVPMWQKIYSGTEDWKMGKPDPFASVLAAAEREERESR